MSTTGNAKGTLESAIRVAVDAHAGQTDKNGDPYITHPMRLMHHVQGDAAKIVAVLHDVVEDTPVTPAQLRAEGFGDDVLASLALVTHVDGGSYADYVVRLKADPVAREVKLADLTDNTRIERCLLRVDKAATDFARLHRYVLSYRFLTDQLSETDYRGLMTRYGHA